MSDSTNSLHSSTISLPSSSCDIFEKYTEDYLQGPFKRCLFPAVGLTEFPGNVKSTEGVRRLRGPYRKYTLSEKQQAVAKILAGENVKQISKLFGIPLRNLLRWRKEGCARKEGGGRPTDTILEQLLYKMISQETIVGEQEIRKKAKKLSVVGSFKASKSWYIRFWSRYQEWQQDQTKHQKQDNVHVAS